MFGLVLDLVDLPSKPIHVIIVNGGEPSAVSKSESDRRRSTYFDPAQCQQPSSNLSYGK
jgi:hypothetical protein